MVLPVDARAALAGMFTEVRPRMTKRQTVDLSDLDRRPSNKNPACTCGFDADGRYNWQCDYHMALNARLDAMKVRPVES